MKDIEQYEVSPEDFWDEDRVRFSDGFDRAHAAAFYGWRVVGSWGHAGYNLGNHPYVIVFFRELPAVRDLPAVWEIAVNTEGDVVAYQCPTEEIRIQVTDTIAFDDWQHQGMPWVTGLSSEVRGLPLYERLVSEIVRVASLPASIVYPQGPTWEHCCESVKADIEQGRHGFPMYDQGSWKTLHPLMSYVRFQAQAQAGTTGDRENVEEKGETP